MRTIDDNALKAQSDQAYINTFIQDNESFILQAAYKATGQYITKSDDKWSVALSAFLEAIKSYSKDKGAFFAFADLVIKRRLYDDYKKQSRHFKEIPINPYSFESDKDDEEEEDIEIKREVLASVVSRDNEDARLEIEAISAVLQSYDISFMDLVSVSPKSLKTKKICAKAIVFVNQNKSYFKEMRKTKSLPLKEIENFLHLPRKTLERHRKYIIAAIEIISGDFPVLSEYLKFVREELPR